MVILQVYVNISLKLPGTGKILPCDTRTRVLGCGLPNVTNSPLRFGSSGRSILTSHTSFESSWPSDFDYLSFGSIP